MSRHRALGRKLWRDLWHLRSQLVAIAVVMVCGMAMFVSLRSMHGWLRDTQATYYAQYRFADVFAHARRVPNAMAATLAAIPGVADVRTRLVTDVTLDLPGLEEPGTGRLVGVTESRAPTLNDLHLRRGRWIQRERPDEVLVSAAFADANGLLPGDTLLAVINGRRQVLHIVGVALSPEFIYEIRGLGDVFPDNRRFGVIWMGELALGAAFQMTGAFNDVAIALAPGASEPDVIAEVDRALAPFGGSGAYGREDHLSHLFVSSEIEETEITSLLLPGIFLGVTAFLLQLVMGRLVATQRDQIAVLKAFGYTNGTVAAHYLQLALVPVLVGAVGGVTLGVWLAGALAGIYGRFYQFPVVEYVQAWDVVAIAFAVAGGAALIGALGAVRRAVRLPPTEAMRPEAPAAYHRGLLGRLGLERSLSPATRILVRGLLRRPLRAGLSVLGIAFATAIVMTGWFMFDAVDVMQQIQFQSIQRHDAMVVFESARPARARWELERVEGVLAVEPFRTVAVRLRHEQRSVRTAILGLDQGAELQRLVDRHGVRHTVPRAGLILSDVLAQDLDVKPGDEVQVEVLEGQRVQRSVVVASIMEDVIGSSATMERRALHALVAEGDVLSGAYLRVDPASAPATYRALKELPAIGGVIRRESVMQGFAETIEESFMISIVIMVGFAAVISAGIIYNGARVALSERGRELASLRVLGFFREEVARLLLGEQALLTVAGIPLGLLFGTGLAWLITVRFESNLFRIPLVIRPTTVAYSVVLVATAAVLSALAVRQRVHRLNLIAVLKTRE